MLVERSAIDAIIQDRLNVLGITATLELDEDHHPYMDTPYLHWRFEQENVRGTVTYSAWKGVPVIWLRCWGRSYLAGGIELPGTEAHTTYQWKASRAGPKGWSKWEYEHD